jgi:hypothetical protein
VVKPRFGCADSADRTDLPASTFDFVLRRNTPYLARRLRTLRIQRWLRKPDAFRASRKPNTIRLCHGPPLVAKWVSPPVSLR